MGPLPGFRDFYPEPLPTAEAWSAHLRLHLFGRWRETARRYGFREYDGPPLESLELFTLKSGEEIVGQLYHFTDKGGRAVALRPEMTPTLARMAAAHERHYRKPLKWFSIPQLFRYERQQKGRLREHFQLNADIIGERGPGADAELIALLVDTLRDLGLTAEDFVVRLSSRNAWQAFFAQRCPDLDKAYDFYQAIDKLERESPETSQAKLAALGFSLEEVRAFIAAAEPTPELASILRDLAARGMSDFIKVDYTVIRGLAYYTGPVFEAFDKKGEFRAIAGGGRYDNLVKLVSNGKVDLPALGFGMGDVVLAQLLKERGVAPKPESPIEVCCLIEAEELREESLRWIQRLREAGVPTDYSLSPVKSDKQFKRAVELGAAYTVKVERSAGGEFAVRLKHLSSREERVLGPDEALAALAPGQGPARKPA
jgi:histidyl-tRNA synthetase